MSRFRLSALLVLTVGAAGVMWMRRSRSPVHSYVAPPRTPAVEPQVTAPEPVVFVEPELAVEPEPQIVVEPEPVQAVEPVLVLEPEPEPLPEVESEPVADTEPEPGYWEVPPALPADWSDERRSA